MLAVLSSFAQEESKNASENIKQQYRKKFERGELFINTNYFLGYDKDYFIEKLNVKKNDANVLVRYKTQQLIKIIKEAEILKKFDIDIYFKIIEKMIVFVENKIIVTQLDGTQVEVVIE